MIQKSTRTLQQAVFTAPSAKDIIIKLCIPVHDDGYYIGHRLFKGYGIGNFKHIVRNIKIINIKTILRI